MLSGIRVVSFTHFLQGPSATQMLADLGAEVVKIESPAGAFERSWSGPDAYVGDASVFFLLGNRNVQSLSIDLKSEKAKSILLKLIDDADVLIESFRPGALERLGFGYEELSARNPRLVYCSLSGYGSAGPYRDRPGQDLLLQSLSGLAHATGSADSPPTSVGASVIDQHGAVLGAFGILGALLGRERTGKGCKVESNLLNAALDLQIEPISYYLNGFRGERSSTGIGSRYYKAPYGIYRTADGHITVSITALSILSEAFDDNWFTTIAADDEYNRREEINERISKHLAERTTQEWEAHFTEHKVWFAPRQRLRSRRQRCPGAAQQQLPRVRLPRQRPGQGARSPDPLRRPDTGRPYAASRPGRTHRVHLEHTRAQRQRDRRTHTGRSCPCPQRLRKSSSHWKPVRAWPPSPSTGRKSSTPSIRR